MPRLIKKIISCLVSISGLLVSWHYIDMDSSSILQSKICPVLMIVFTIAIIVNFDFLFSSKSGSGGQGGDNSHSFGSSEPNCSGDGGSDGGNSC